jgi:hypothetical protein
MIIAELPKANATFKAGETWFTGASFWEHSGGIGWRCVWTGELHSEDSLREMTASWKVTDKKWRPGLVVVSNHATGDVCHIEPRSLLN